jgi:hypothetical protein
MPKRARVIFNPAEKPNKVLIVWFKKCKPFLVSHRQQAGAGEHWALGLS